MLQLAENKLEENSAYTKALIDVAVDRRLYYDSAPASDAA